MIVIAPPAALAAVEALTPLTLGPTYLNKPAPVAPESWHDARVAWEQYRYTWMFKPFQEGH
jgi:hypothetical protein